MSEWVNWCFEPSQPQRITSGLNTNFTLCPSYSFHKSSYHKSCFFDPIYIPRALNTGTCIQQGDLFYSAGLHRNHVLVTANTGKNRERFWKKCRRMDRKCRNEQERKKSLAISVACMAIYWLTPGFKGRTFKLCVLTRWDFNFCVRSSPLRGSNYTWENRQWLNCTLFSSVIFCFFCG